MKVVIELGLIDVLELAKATHDKIKLEPITLSFVDKLKINKEIAIAKGIALDDNSDRAKANG